jgi:hypothetical protein
MKSSCGINVTRLNVFSVFRRRIHSMAESVAEAAEHAKKLHLQSNKRAAINVFGSDSAPTRLASRRRAALC